MFLSWIKEKFEQWTKGGGKNIANLMPQTFLDYDDYDGSQPYED